MLNHFIMKRIFLLSLLLPAVIFGQVKPKTTTATKSADGYTINGTVTGYEDSATVTLLNGQTGAQLDQATIIKGKFSFKGKMDEPDFRILLFNGQPPFITLFLDNSNIKITGNKATLDHAVVTGSVANKIFTEYNNEITPYQYLFNDDAPYDSIAIEKAAAISKNFAKKYPNSAVSALAIIRFNQITEDEKATEELYNSLTESVKGSGMGKYIAQLIADAQRTPIGSKVPDFTQTDTAGNPVSLSSFRGRYVLVDFWASWCRPCRAENPNVVANYNKYKDKNFTVLSVSLDQAKPAWLDAIKMDGLTWQHVSDLRGWQNAVAQQFGIMNIPQNILVAPDGTLAGKNLRGPKLNRRLSRLLK
jgi:peroxiredoxin